MFYLIVQTVLLIAIAFILGAILGCLLRRWFAADTRVEPTATADKAVPVAGAGAAALSTARAPHLPDAPVPELVPKPVAAPVAPVPPTPVVEERPEEVELPDPAPTSNDAPPAAAPAAFVGGGVEDEASDPIVPAAGEADNLKLIRGIGPQNESRLNAIGVNRFAQIASWTKKDQREIGERLSFPGRIEREEWVSQAKKLAKGGTTEFSSRASAGRVKTSSGVATVSAPGIKPPMLDAARGGKPDNLTLIDGVGNAIERKLFKLGIFHFDQVAAWSEDEGIWIGNEIGFPGRVARENWIGESKVFAEGGATEHATRVERGQIKTSRKSTPEEK